MRDVVVGIPTYFAPGQMFTNCINAVLLHVPDAKIFAYKNQIGWLKACNYIMQNTTEDIILLNDDTIPLNNFVNEMQKVAYSDDKIGIVGAKILSPNQENIINYGIYIGKDGNTAHKHFGEHKDKVNKVETQKAVEGSCIYLKRDMLNEIGYFDEGYGAGIREEVDLAFRAREAGWKVVSCPTAEIVHLVSATHSKLGIKDDNFSYFVSKWGKKLALGQV